MKIKDLKNKKILILGMGKEGTSTLNFLRNIYPEKRLGVGDRLTLSELNEKTQKVIEKDEKLNTHLGEDYLQFLKKYDVIIKSPGVPPQKIKPFIKKKQKITSQTQIFFEECSGKIIGITGTKGKSTTASLIHKILKDNRLKTNLLGNIGNPALSFLNSATSEDIYVYELSSHQLLNLKKSPFVAVLLNVYPEHLDYYRNFQEYVRAKSNITKYQTKKDFLIFNSEDKTVEKIAQKSKAKKVPIDIITFKESNLPIKGKFNLNNIKAAIAVAEIFDIPRKEIIKSIKKFKPLPHRLEYVGTYKGIKFYNDALSTIPEATIAALDTLGNKVQTIFLGGFDRGLNFEKLAERILQSKIKTLILFPTTGEKIWREVLKQQAITEPDKNPYKKHKVFLVQNMPDAVKLAFKYTNKGKICLLSTASPSFSLFRDYREKGNLFKKYVKKYGKDS